MILQLNNEKTIGFVCTPVSVLSDPFSHIIDLFSKQALDPECLKIAQVTPAHKQNDTHFCSYYRLKSLLPVFGKLFEKTYDIENAFIYCTIHHFADNTSISYANNNIQNIEETINSELKRIANWLAANKLSLNESKFN